MNEVFSAKRRILALWFPFLPADRLRKEEPDTRPDAPLALVEKVRGALRLGAVDARALALGVTAGLTLADARVRLPELIVADMDPAADRHWLDRLGRHCVRWSPLTAVAPPDGIVIDISGCAHLFGGEEGLMAAVEDEMTARGMTIRCAASATAEAAQALARYAPLPVADEASALRALPVAALGLEADATQALLRAGLKTVGDVARRPAATIAGRFGMGAVTALRCLLEEEQSPLNPLPPPVSYRFERRFAEPIGHSDAVAACFLELLNEARLILEEKDLGGRHFRLTLCRSDGVRRHLAIETGLPTRDPALVLRLFDERIETLTDPLDPGFGYDSILLAILSTEPLTAAQPALVGDAGEDEHALAALIDRLSTRLGAESLVRLAPQDNHIPEQAQLALPAIRTPAPIPWPAAPADEPPMRPLFLFDPPQPVEVIAQVPDGPPHRFRWRRTLHEVRLYEGPERIAGEWWRRKGGEYPGGAGLTRDYYRVEDVRGRRFWIFRHGLYDEKPDPRWYLHGLFA
ncbi:DNA polymerase Y family protein [Sphingobium subterraneum]|uniref:Protein ImuB n=1 Tax=Sphingobium subterraneum TaxID=627688 RepID=A0A841IWQ4_9SPHN|nr:protein ImuB [Sphingobium subterraneum]